MSVSQSGSISALAASGPAAVVGLEVDLGDDRPKKRPDRSVQRRHQNVGQIPEYKKLSTVMLDFP